MKDRENERQRDGEREERRQRSEREEREEIRERRGESPTNSLFFLLFRNSAADRAPPIGDRM
jgi:hypothetical protein